MASRPVHQLVPDRVPDREAVAGMTARIPRRKNPNAPWLWQYQDRDGRWTDLSSAEWSYRQPNDEGEDDDTD